MDLLYHLREQFYPTEFKITKEESKNTFYVKSIENNYCCTIFINDKNEIEIGLHKCSISGGEILEKIENFAKSVGINKLTLGDISELDLGCIKLDLAIFYILHSNRSWYNSKGYFSRSFKNEQSSNAEILIFPIYSFLEQCFDKMSDEDHKRTDNKDKLLNGIQYFSKDNSIKTTDFFNIAKESMRKEDICDPTNKDKYKWLEYAVDIVSRSGKIEYDNNLSKSLSIRGGKTKNKKIKKRKSKSKSRSRKTK